MAKRKSKRAGKKSSGKGCPSGKRRVRFPGNRIACFSKQPGKKRTYSAAQKSQQRALAAAGRACKNKGPIGGKTRSACLSAKLSK